MSQRPSKSPWNGLNRVKNIDLLDELPFYEELSIEKISHAFKRCEKSYEIEIIDSKLEASKSSVEDFKYQITVKVLLRKHKENEGIEFAPVKYNSD